MKTEEKKPIAVIITDTHMHDKNIKIVKSIFRQTFDYCLQNKVKYIFHAGDWFTSRTGQSIACLMATKDILKEMHEEYGLQMWVIAGNHDKADQTNSNSFLSVFEGMSGFNLINIFGGVPLNFGCKLQVNMIPYFTKEIFEEQLADLVGFLFETPGDEQSQKQILITHTSINGVKNNDGTSVTEGTPTNLFHYFDSVFVGHYHNKSKVGKNIYYIGSAYQANFGEDEHKGITVLYSDGSHQQVELNFPKYVKFFIEAEDLKADTILGFIDLKKKNPENNYRIVLNGSEQEVKAIELNTLEENGVSIQLKIKDVLVLEPNSDFEVVTYNRENIVTAFKTFCDLKDINPSYGLDVISKLQ